VGLVSSALASEHGGTTTVKRQTGVVSGILGEPGIKRNTCMPIVFNVKIAICLIFAAATSSCRVYVPLLSRVGTRKRAVVEASKQSANETKLDY